MELSTTLPEDDEARATWAPSDNDEAGSQSLLSNEVTEASPTPRYSTSSSILALRGGRKETAPIPSQELPLASRLVEELAECGYGWM
jgi:hypothetical protein